MWILVQDKSCVVNISKYSRLGISIRGACPFSITAVIDGVDYEARSPKSTLGGYSTQEKAVAVFKEMFEQMEQGAKAYEMPIDA